MNDFYMDDLMTGADSIEECCKLQEEIISILDSAKLPLRKWCSNSMTVLKRIGKRDNDPSFTLDIGDIDAVNSLGHCWKPVADEFQFNSLVKSNCKNLTKRAILSDLNKVFDPLGFLTPVLIKGKIFLQQLWQTKTNWDSPLPKKYQEKWEDFYNNLEELRFISIPRSARMMTSSNFEINGFCDASMEAFGVVLYVRTKDEHGQYHTITIPYHTNYSAS